MNESETRAEYIDPKLKASGWGEVEGSKILREFRITDGKLRADGKREHAEFADYVLVYRNRKVAVVEAKSAEKSASEGVMQAKAYAEKLRIPYAYATNGRETYEMAMKLGREGDVDGFPTPDELWARTYAGQDAWKERFMAVPEEGERRSRFYQELAVTGVLDAIAEERTRILLTLATGTGKTSIAFQIAWKLFQTRWNLSRNGGRRPRILFLADRNVLARQAFNEFALFPDDARVRITPGSVRKGGGVPTSGSVFFTIFQTFMSGPGETPYFGDYPPDFFDLIIIDECHRGGANDEGRWRGILEYFAPAVQLGLTATPKRKDNVDTYRYFGEPVYAYSLKEGVNDGFLTPFKVKRISTTLDEYIYTSDDTVVEGEVEEGRVYKEPDFQRIIFIKEREAERVRILMREIDQNEKTIVFCATQEHAAAVRDLINQHAASTNPFYCVRVTADDGARGDQYLAEFRDSEKTIPTVLTTSQKLSTGVDARNVRNIVLMRPVSSMIEFKQIIGRGTRLFEGKAYFTVYDFVDAYHLFSDPEWDGEPLEVVSKSESHRFETDEQPEKLVLADRESEAPKKRLVIRLRDGKEHEIQHMIATLFWSADGKPVSPQEFVDGMLGALTNLCPTEDGLRAMWSDPGLRASFLEKMAAAGYGLVDLKNAQKALDAEKSDLFDVLALAAFSVQPVSRAQRVERSLAAVQDGLGERQREFAEFVLAKYLENGEGELGKEKLPVLLNLKYGAIDNARELLGEVEDIRALFSRIQAQLYAKRGGEPSRIQKWWDALTR